MVVYKKALELGSHGFIEWPYSCSDMRIWTGKEHFWIDIPRRDEVSFLAELQENEIGHTASVETCVAVFDHNPDSYRIFRTGSGERDIGTIRGFASCLFLNNLGLEALKSGTFQGRLPDLKHLAAPGMRPTATYAWALVAKGFGESAVKHVLRSYAPELYAGVPVWCTAGSDAGVQLINAEGFASVRGGNSVGGVFSISQPLASQSHP